MRITMHHKQLAQENHNFSGNTWHSDSRGYEYKHILTSTAKIVLVTKIWCGIYINQIWYIKTRPTLNADKPSATLDP